MELDITFSCKCSAFLDEVVYCDGPDISAATDEESLREYWKTFICDGCGQEYDAHIVSRMSECSGQLNLATALESSQNLRSDSFGLNPAL